MSVTTRLLVCAGLLGLSPLPAADPPPFRIPRDANLIALNQIGFETAREKRFTAPLTPDKTPFIVRALNGGPALYKGTVTGHIGDFSGFKPKDVPVAYVVQIDGGGLKVGVSDPFFVHTNLLEDLMWQPAIDFLIDSRSVTGTHPSAYGGTAWRDGTYYDFIIPSLVLMELADPRRVAQMPHQINWDADKRRVLDPNFKYDANNPLGGGVMDTVKRYYTELEPPAVDAPDVVKLIHWGTGMMLINPASTDPSADPDGSSIHSQSVEQAAYVVWAWPQLSKWLPRSFYEKCRDFCFTHWDASTGIDKWWNPETYQTVAELTGKDPTGGTLHPFKGRHAPGHSIVPNLLMYEVAKRENRDDAEKYMTAAVQQTQWIIDHLDWNDPRTTKGQRISEHRTITNLVWFLQNYPDKAPAGLRAKITDWAKVAVSRSNNLWDFRRYDEGENWTIPKLSDVGNVAGFPAIALSASWVVEDKGLKSRLRQLATAHADDIFGRNPRVAASPHDPRDFNGIERGWPKGYQDNTCARLELCRGSISSSAGSEMYPFNPDGAYRHPEGWVCYGADWCVSLAYFQFDKSGGRVPAKATRE